MARPSDKEYKLLQKVKDLEQQVEKLNKENAQLEKRLNKEPKIEKTKVVKHQGGCPSCQAPIKVTDLPFGKLRICSAACGWKIVDKDKV